MMNKSLAHTFRRPYFHPPNIFGSHQDFTIRSTIFLQGLSLFVQSDLQGLQDSLVVDKQLVLDRGIARKYFLQIYIFQLFWVDGSENIFEFLIGDVAVSAWIKLFQQKSKVFEQIGI